MRAKIGRNIANTKFAVGLGSIVVGGFSQADRCVCSSPTLMFLKERTSIELRHLMQMPEEFGVVYFIRRAFNRLSQKVNTSLCLAHPYQILGEGGPEFRTVRRQLHGLLLIADGFRETPGIATDICQLE
jgi:hypothetical protein